MQFSKKLVGAALVCILTLMLALFSSPKLAATIQVGFPVLARTGNTNTYATSTGAVPSGHCASWDASGNIIDSGAVGCQGSAGGGTTNQNIRTFGATFDGGGSALTGTLTRCTNIYSAGTIQQVVLIADASGSVTVDVQTVAQAAYTGPASASSITAADTPALSAAVRFSDTTLTGWTTALSANTVACFVMSSPTTVKWVQATVKVAAN
jgi:hypothetical protein